MDIVERLKAKPPKGFVKAPLMIEAADEIERLREALQYYECDCKMDKQDCDMVMEAATEIERVQEKPELTPAQYWEAQASMWHENYKEAMAYEEKARRYKVALERIRDSGYGTKERIRLIIKKALEETA